jgi:ribosomal protein S7
MKINVNKACSELIAASNGEGSAVKKKEDTHKWQKLTKHLHILNGK